MRPTSVSMPVAVTTQSARPLVMTVDEITILLRSPSTVPSGSTASACLSTGTDSPVMADSSAFRLALSRMRASAGTRSPASSTMMSPGTRKAVSSRTCSPPRTTLARGADIFCSASRAFSALSSWEMEMQAFTPTMTRMMTASTQSSPPEDARDRAAAASSTRIMGSRIWSRNRAQRGFFGAPASWLGPYLSSRAWASWGERPERPDSSPARVWAAVLSYHWLIVQHSFSFLLNIAFFGGRMVGKGDKRETKKTYPQRYAVDRSYRFRLSQREFLLLLTLAAGQNPAGYSPIT